MSGILEGKGIVVFGNDEIGLGIALRLVREGARVAVLTTQPTELPGAADLISLPVDLRAADAIDSAIAQAAAKLGGLYGLVNNVLPQPTIAPLEQQSASAFSDAFQCVQASVHAMQAALSYLRAGGEGRIVNIGHRYGENINEGLAAYNAAAWSLVGITRTAAVEWGQYQIATNLLLPLADTAALREARARRPKVLDLMQSQLPLRRAGDCIEDVGGAALFLLSDAANFVNGEIVHADGGQHVAGPLFNPSKFAS